MMTLTHNVCVCVFTFNLHNLSAYMLIRGMGSLVGMDASSIVPLIFNNYD